MLKTIFIELLIKYTDNKNLITGLWLEIEQSYSSNKRHYHTLEHLDHLLVQLVDIKEYIQNWEGILFALYYHDIIYNPLRTDNEEKSAKLAKKRLKQLSVSPGIIEHCEENILATKSHNQSAFTDTNYFIDADLSVLGHPWDVYSTYYQNVRKEYSMFPDLIYKPGRKKVINHFLDMDRIFKTDFFYHKFEIIAKQNLQKELELL